jgi:tetratricopeptide (TPR) repeat protein
MRILIATLLLLASGLPVLLPAQVNRDSLRQIWENESLHDTLRLKAIHEWAWDMRFKDPDSLFSLTNTELAYAQSRGHRFWEARAINSAGVYYYIKGDFAKSYSHFKKALDIFTELEDWPMASTLSGNIGLVLRNQGNNLAALDFFQKALAIDQQYGFSENLSTDYLHMGILFQDKGDYPKALEYFQKSLDLYTSEAKIDLAQIYNNIGAAYASMSPPDNPRALEYFRKSLALRQEQGDKVAQAMTLHNLWEILSQMEQPEQARESLEKALDIYTSLGDKNGLANVWYDMGYYRLAQGDNAGAMIWCRKALEAAREASGLLKQRDACQCLYQAYKASGQTAKALEFHEQYKLLTDSLQREELDLRLSQMEFSRAILADSLAMEEEKLKTELSYQAELRKKNRGVRIVLLIALGLLLVTLAFLARMTYFQRRSEKYQSMAQQLEKQQLINEVTLLKTQINPHFLFNSLSILSSLVHFDADLSEKFIQQLSRSYRYILEQRDQSLVSLRTELEFIEAYSFLLKIRFENKFDIKYELPEHALDQYKIAPLTLQLLIENAVKHNRMSTREPLIIRVDMQDGMLQVKNRMQVRSASTPSTGLGLENIRNSYALLSDRPVWAGEREGEFIVKVPLIA